MKNRFTISNETRKGSLLKAVALAFLVFLLTMPCQAMAKNPLAAENANLKILGERLQVQQARSESLEGVLAAMQVQATAYKNLLDIPATKASDLVLVRKNIHEILRSLEDRVSSLSQQRDALAMEQHETEKEYQLAESRRAGLLASSRQGDDAELEVNNLLELLALWNKKQEIQEDILFLYAKDLASLEEEKQSFAVLSDKVQERIQEKKVRALFEKKDRGLPQGLQGQMLADLFVFSRIALVARQGLSGWGDDAQKGRFGRPEYFLTGFMLAVLAGLWFGRKCRAWLGRAFFDLHPWWKMPLELFSSSTFLVFAAAFVFAYQRLAPPGEELAISLLLEVGLFSVLTGWWVLEMVKLLAANSAGGRLVSLAPMFRLLAAGSIVFAIILGLGGLVMDPDRPLMILVRFACFLFLFIWSVLFWKKAERCCSGKEDPPPAWFRLVQVAGTAAGYVVALFGAGMEFLGYSHLAQFWLASCFKTLAVFVWGLAFYLALNDWKPPVTEVDEEAGVVAHTRQTLAWLSMRLGWLVWLALGCGALLFAWGADRKFFGLVFNALNHTVGAGNVHVSVLSIVYGVIVLLCTHAVVGFFRVLFQRRVLAGSGMDTGSSDSLTTLFGYVLWVVGILISLSVMGMSTTSLAVGFGAIGIGLGFGLQNIFNNFFSGLILLFERPIQVGDAIEINGIWGEVRKINIRSTVVQTYDNASLIIPNSDLVSNQVTNWSFKDLRIRRNIHVGVAYGSDVDLVRDTLLEAAAKNTRTLKRPKPECLFLDFADSSLLFRLRFWTRVEYFFTVESEVRFEIDRLFRERKITIPFPQRDLHINSASGLEGIREAISKGDKPSGK